MIKLKKIIKITLLCIISMFLSINGVWASLDIYLGDGNQTPSSPSGSYDNPSEGDSTGTGAGGDYMYHPVGYAWGCSVTGSSCTPSYGIYDSDKHISLNLYNTYNNSIINQTIISQRTIAGTAVGTDLYEKITLTWWAKGLISTTITCKQWAAYSCMGTCCANRSCTVSYACPSTCYAIREVSYGGTSWSQDCQNTANRLGYEYVKSELEKQGASYSLNIADPNDARCGNPEKYADELKKDGVVCNNYNVSAVPGNISSYEESLKNGGKVTKKIHYEMYGACINVKTGKVRYLDKDNKCNENEYYIENDNENENTRHWHIFTPLNTKTTDGYILAMTPNDKTIENSTRCQKAINDYASNYEYVLYIKPLTGTFVKNIEIDKKKVSNGCYLQTIITIPTIQKFYGEEITEDSDILKGFNFYYRPIDIDNPFPNGINDDSYWKTWYDTEKKEPNLKESFKEATYWTNNIDLNSIREYNEESSYLDWENMNIDGTSSFISTQGIINRSSTINKNSVYNLGCAPTNMCEYYIKDGEKVENPVYQPECKNAKIGVSCP